MLWRRYKARPRLKETLCVIAVPKDLELID